MEFSMITALAWFGASAGVLVVLGILYLCEDSRGDRLMLRGLREITDRGFVFIGNRLNKIYQHISHWTTRLVLQHGVYRLLGSVVGYLAKLEQKVEQAILRSHRARSTEKRERTHLDEIADHKEAVALTDAEKQQRRNGE